MYVKMTYGELKQVLLDTLAWIQVERCEDDEKVNWFDHAIEGLKRALENIEASQL